MINDPLAILIADPDRKIHKLFENLVADVPNLTLYTAFTSSEAIQMFSLHHIDIAFIDLYLYPIHGLEILKKLKAILPQADVVITSYEPMIQNFRACLTYGALDFIAKPFTLDTLKQILEKRKTKPYEPHVFSYPEVSNTPFLLKERSVETYIKFWGTRGSHSVSGANYIRFGGNTSCLEIHSENNLVVIDAGTGLTNLGQELIQHPSPGTIELFIGHTHLDHMAGLPGFAPLHDPHFGVTIHAPINFYKNTKELLSDMLSHAFFPVDLEEIKASLKFKEMLSYTPVEVGPIKIECHYAYHPGTTLGFKIQIGNLKIGYVTDNEVLMGYTGDPKVITADHPLLEAHQSFIDFFKKCDILIHEAQYEAKVYPHKIGWGHSSIYNACILVKYIEPKIWIVTHHDPEDTDEMLQKKFELITDACDYLEIPTSVRMAFDGLKINL